MMKGIYLLLGSNIGESQMVMLEATKKLEQRCGEIVARSSFYWSEPWGVHEQPAFLNQVIEISSELSPQQLLSQILLIEKELGRVRYEKWHERLIDIDILYYGSEVIDEPDLAVPHPHIADRRFTLEPLVEICPTFSHPVLQKTQSVMLAECSDHLKVEKLLKSIETP